MPNTSQLTQLPGGIRVATCEMPYAQTAAMGIWASVGGRHEPAKLTGISHFIEHMLFKGTEKRGTQEIARELDTIGGYSDAFTGKELVSYNAKVLEEHVPIAFDILSDMVMRPKFDATELQKEKGVVLEEIKMDLDNPESQTHELFCRKYWMEDALGWPILGTPKTVRSFTREMAVDYWGRHYVASNMLVTAAGKVNHDRFVKMIEATMGAMPKTKPLRSEERRVGKECRSRW